MDFVLALHSHLPWVLHHGRWPHGSDWLCEAAVDTYLPLLDTLQQLEREDVSTPVTLGITPVLAAQLSHPSFVSELDAFLAQRFAACEAAPASLSATGDSHLLPLAHYWKDRLLTLQGVMRRANNDLIGAFRDLERRGRLELISSCATHGFLPLLGRDESIRLQLHAGRREHRRQFGGDPTGLWLPECAFRPPGPWHPRGARAKAHRRGTADHLRDAGYRYFFVDAHLPQAGEFLGLYVDVPLGAARDDSRDIIGPPPERVDAVRSPYRGYRMPGPAGADLLAALVRDPRSTRQVWSRQEGYPGDEWYLEFHKMRWPGGLKLWRVTGGDVDLGGKQPYVPGRARDRARVHAEHFAHLLQRIAASEMRGRVIVAPFDTELFGHWWFEGVDFVADVYRCLTNMDVRPVTAREHVARHPPRDVVQLSEGSWGANGDFSMWMNDQTSWTWQRLWPLEDGFWDVARGALAGGEASRRVLAQAARSLLLAQASDWQFIISTGAATDYAEMRFANHCSDAEQLVGCLKNGLVEEGVRRADVLATRDDLFPDVLESVATAIA